MTGTDTKLRVGILGAGQMGSAIGSVLVRHGRLDVVTALDGRGELTRRRAAEAGLRDVGDVAALVREADVILSVLRPAAAQQATSGIAKAIRATSGEAGQAPVFVDCNAIPPRAARHFDEMITAAGGRFVDAAIQSPPPRDPGLLLYASGPHAAELAFLRERGIDVRVLPGPVGQASALDLVVGGASKLFEAAAAQIFLAARHWKLEDILHERVPRIVHAVEHLAPLMPSRAARWAEEMTETSHFMAEMGLPGGVFDGAAEVLALIAGSDAVRNGAEAQWPATQREVITLIAQDLEKAGVLPPPLAER